MTMQTEIDLGRRSGSAIASGKAFTSLLGLGLRKNIILLLLVLAYYLAALAIGVYTERPVNTLSPTILVLMLASLVPLFLASMIIWRFAYMATYVRPEKPIGWLVQDFKTTIFLDYQRLLSGGIAIFASIFFVAAFSYVKEAIPELNPFAWDETFARMDRQMHGGVDAYMWLSPILANDTMIRVVDKAYSAWFLLIYFFVFVACMDRENPIRRNAYLMSFTLTWIIGGSILATVFSSVGPIYFQDFGLGDQFLPLKDILLRQDAQRPLLAVEMQTRLLQNHLNGTDVGGISAMPSMHLATSWVMAFHAFRYSSKLGWIMVGFAVLIQLGSVILGWHYAIDGYAGFLVAAACWFGGSKLAQIQSRIDEPLDVSSVK